jgi:dTDP-4-amino-4,6-dideoxygalactose transaminase
MIPFLVKKQLNSARFNHYLQEANKTNQFTNYGYAVKLLEERAKIMLKIDDSKAVIATSNGTTALNAIIYGMNVKDSKEYRVSTQAFTFPTNYLGAARGAIITDMTAQYNMSLDNQYLVQYSDLVIVTNIFGHLQNLEEIMDKTEGRDKKLIFDNAATPYSFWGETNSCNLGTASFISLHHTKPIGFGEGGLAIIDKKYEEEARAACTFGIINGAPKEQSGNYKMSELAAAGILQWWDQFDIDEMQKLFMKNYVNLQNEMRNSDGEHWINHTSSKWFPVCLPFIYNTPIKELSGEDNGREFKKYYKPLSDGFLLSNMMYDNIKCLAITEGIELCLNK